MFKIPKQLETSGEDGIVVDSGLCKNYNYIIIIIGNYLSSGHLEIARRGRNTKRVSPITACGG